MENMFLNVLMGAAGGGTVGYKPNPEDDDPPPWWGPWAKIFAGIVGGILVSKLVGADSMAASGLAAFAGGKVLSDVLSLTKIVR